MKLCYSYFMWIEDWDMRSLDLIRGKQGEETVEQKLALCYQVLDASNEQIAVIDTKYHYIFANKAYINAQQKTKEEIENKHLRDIIGEDSFINVMKPQLEECYLGKEVSYESWIKFQDKVFKFMQVKYTALRDNENKVIAISVSYRDLTEQQKLEVALRESKQIIEQISITDWLTDLHSKIYFDDIFPNMINISKRNNQLLVLGLINIDHFNEYNATYGESAGDDVLKSIAQSLKNSFKRPNDYTFRLEGDTFAILFNVAKSEDVKLLAEKTHQCIEALEIEHSNSSISPYITISMGCTIINPKQNDSTAMIYQNAQKLLKTAKNEGKNKICYV